MEKLFFSKPYTPLTTISVLQQILAESVQQGDGVYSKKVESIIDEMYPDSKALLTPSCTASLELALMLLDLKPGEEVITPSFNFTSSATSITKYWGVPVFCDIDKATGCIDVEKIEELITAKTRAIMWVNYAGLSPDLGKLRTIADKYGLLLIEDAAHNFGVLTEKQRRVTGDFVTFSFHATKNIHCGEGGAILINNQKYLERAYVMREKGTNRREFSKGLVSKYSWVDRGASYLLAEINSGILWSQLQIFNEIQEVRSCLIKKYMHSLSNIEEYGWKVLTGVDRAAHMFAILAPDQTRRDGFINAMTERKIPVVSHYQDLASSKAGMLYAPRHECIVSIGFSNSIVRFPLYYELTDSLQDMVLENTYSVISKLRA